MRGCPAAPDSAVEARENHRRMDEIEQALTALRAEVSAYADRAGQLEAACKLEREARDSLLTRIDALLGKMK